MHRGDAAHAHRWDYGVGFRAGAGQRTCAVWVEVHPANPGAVSDVLRRAAWIRTWLAPGIAREGAAAGRRGGRRGTCLLTR